MGLIWFLTTYQPPDIKKAACFSKSARSTSIEASWWVEVRIEWNSTIANSVAWPTLASTGNFMCFSGESKCALISKPLSLVGVSHPQRTMKIYSIQLYKTTIHYAYKITLNTYMRKIWSKKYTPMNIISKIMNNCGISLCSDFPNVAFYCVLYLILEFASCKR